MKKKVLALLLILTIAVLAVCGLSACVNNHEKLVTELEMYTLPQRNYVLGEALSLDGAQVLIKYDDGTEELKKVDESMISTFDPNRVGDQILVVNFGGVTTGFTVTVSQAQITDLILKAPDKLTYIEGQDLVLTGGEVTVVYANNTKETMPLTADMCLGYDRTRLGEQTVRVVVQIGDSVSQTAFVVTVVERTLTGLLVHRNPEKTIYYPGEAIDLTGGTLFLQYDNGYPEYVDMATAEGLTVNWDNRTVSNYSNVNIEYLGKQTAFQVRVLVRDVASMRVITPPVEQAVELDLNLTGALVEITYNNGEKERISLADPDRVQVLGYDKNLPGKQTLQLVFYTAGVQNATAQELEISVADKSITGLEILPPEGSVLYEDTRLEVVGVWQYRILYSNGTKGAPEYITDGMISRSPEDEVFYYENPGTYSYTVCYEQTETVYEFEVKPLTVAKIEPEGADRVIAHVGHDLEVNGITLAVTYANGAVRNVPLTQEMISGFDSSTAGETTVTITYTDEYTDGFEVPMTVIVVRRVTAITDFTMPHKTEYLVGEAFDPTGMVVYLRYEFQSADAYVDTFNADWWFENEEWAENHSFDTIGEKQIYVTYAGLEKPEEQGFYLTINVHNRITGVRVVQSIPNVVAGALLNTEGVELEISYEVGASKRVPLTPDMTDFDYTDSRLGDRTITITYSDNNSTMSGFASVTVIPSAPSHLEVAADATAKTEYMAADGGVVIDRTGLRVYLVFDNGTRRQLELDSVVFGPLDVNSKGFALTYVYNGEEVRGFYTVRVVETTIVRLEWTDEDPIVIVGEGIPFNWDEIRLSDNTLLKDRYVRMTYSDNASQRDVRLEDLKEEITVSGYNPFNTDTHYPMLYYRGMSLMFAVQVQARRLDSIDVIGGVVTVVEGAVPSVTGLRFELVYDNGTRTAVVLREEYFLYDAVNNPGGYDLQDVTLGERTVNVVYEGKRANFRVNVIQKSLVSLEMDSLPKIRYIEGEELNLDGGVVVLTYDNGQTEKKALTDASLNSPNSVFSVNTVRFDSSEFSGFSKLQTIYVTYRDRDRVLETEFDITMRDRKYLSVEYDANNVTAFYYGDISEENLKFTVWGYNDFNSATRERVMDPTLFKVEYVRYEDRFEPRDPNVDYTALPKDAGQYVMIITYDAEAYADSVHNSMNEMEVVITIEPRVIYVKVEDTVKTYGTDNPQFYYISAMSEEKYRDPTLENDMPFAYGENFLSHGFASQNTQYASLAKDADGNVVRIFNIEALDESRNPIGVTTEAGTYIITVSGAVSQNYRIQYLRSDYRVERRHVSVIPRPVEAEYGVTNIVIGYDTDVWNDGTVDYRNTTGLFGTDTLAGNLMRMPGTDVGKYEITVGTLATSNRNYQVHFINDGTEENGVFVTVYPRKVFLMAENVTYVYGEPMPELRVQAFRDSACTDTDAFAFSTDTLESLGLLEFKYDIALGNVGSYSLLTEITPQADSNRNYELVYVESTLRILPRPVIVTANAGAKIYGEADPVLTYETSGTDDAASGLAEGETLSGVLTRVAGEAVGTYAVRIGTLAAENGNYNITFRAAEFRIDRKVITLTLAEEGVGKVYDGLLPSVAPEHFLFTDTDGNAVTDAELFAGVSLTFRNAGKNAGSYNVALQNDNTNYSVSFDRESYIYEIRQREVEIEYVGLPDGMEYKGEAYAFGAKVKDEYVQLQYNADGTVKTDGDNRPMRDNIDVTLSLHSVTDAGTYTTRATLLSDVNYRLKDSAERTFTVLPRTLKVRVHTADGTLNYQRAFNNQAAAFTANDYEVLNSIDGDNVLFTVRVVNPDGTQNAPKDVRFDAEGQIIPYEIVVDQPINVNYRVELADNYGYMIVPREVKVRIFETHLTKNFDGKEPAIEAAMYSMDSASNLSPSSISFTFVRKENDLRPNHSVGTYQIVLECSDTNHKVSLERDYTYRINQAAVTVTVRGNALTKVYDERPAGFAYSNLTLSSYADITPLVHNFTSDAQLTAMQHAITGLIDRAKATYEAVGNIYPAGDATASYVASAKNLANSYYSDLLAAEQWLQDSTVNRVTAAYNDLIVALDGILSADSTAQMELRIRNANTAARTILEKTGEENFYIAFVFTPITGDDTVTNVGRYSFTMYQNDDNRAYRLTNIRTEFEITKWSVTIETKNVTTIYGETPEVMDYQFITVDSVTGDLLYYDENENICRKEITGDVDPYAYRPIVRGHLTREDANLYSANTYKIILGDDISTNPNYALYYNERATHTIERATIVLQLYENIGLTGSKAEIYYGDVIYESMLQGYTYVSGLTGPFAGSPDIDGEDVIVGDGAVYSARHEGYEITDRNNKVPAGEYTLTASRFSTTNNNYRFEVLPGKVTVQKRNLNLDLNTGYLERVYGDSAFRLTFSGLAYDETSEEILPGGVMPELGIDKTRSAQNTYSPLADVGDYSTLYFARNDAGIALDADGNPVEFDNYILNIDANGYAVRVGAAPLVITLYGNVSDDTLRITYGDVPIIATSVINNTRSEQENMNESVVGRENESEYRLHFAGFRNNDYADRFLNGSGQILLPNVDMNRLKVIDSGEFNYTERMPISDEYYSALSNYEITFGTTNLEVEKKELRVYLGKDINVMFRPDQYDPAAGNYGYKLEPYTADYAYTVSGSAEEPVHTLTGITVTGGQYYYGDFCFDGLVSWDNIDDLFNYYASDLPDPDAGVTGNYTRQGHLELQKTFVHQLIYTPEAGEGKELRLSGLEFAGGSDFANYELVYPATVLNIFAKPGTLTADRNSVVLQGDTADKLQVTLVDESGNYYVHSVQEEGFSVTGFDSSTVMDTPRIAEVSYTRNFGGTSYTAPSQLLVDGTTVNVSNGTGTTSSGGAVSATQIPYWVYAKNTTDVTSLGDISATGNVDASTADQIFRKGSAVNYDGTDMVFRLLGTGNNPQFMLVVNGEGAGADGVFRNSLVLQYYNHRLALVAYDAGGNVANISIADGQGNTVSMPCVTPVLERTASGIRLLDGYTHTLSVRYNRLNNTAYVEVDGVTDGYVSLTQSDESGNIHSLYTPQMSTQPSLVLSQVRGTVKTYALQRQGYHDNAATLARPNENATVQAVQYVSINGGNRATVSLKEFFLPVATQKGYTYQYYLNGTKTLVVTVAEDGTVSESGTDSHTLTAGYYLLEMEVLDASGTMFTSKRVTLWLTNRDATASVCMANDDLTAIGGESVDLYGYDYTPGAEKYYTNETKKSVNYPIVFGNLTSYRSVSFSFLYNAAFTTSTLTGSDVRRQQAVETLITLWASSELGTPKNPIAGSSYAGIALGIEHPQFSQSEAQYNTNLYVTYGNNVYKTVIGDTLNWEDGLMTVELYMNAESGHFTVLVYRNAALVYDITVDESTSFTQGNNSANISRDVIASLVSAQRSAYPAISAEDSRIRLVDATANVDVPANYGYLLNGAYTEAGSAVALSAGQWISQAYAVAGGYGQYFGDGTSAYLELAAMSAAGTFRWYVNYTRHAAGAPAGRGMYLDYNAGTLKFVFFNEGVRYAEQVLATDLALNDGTEHTLKVTYGTEEKESRLGILNLTASGGTVFYKEAFVEIDGQVYTAVYPSGITNMYYWLRADGSSNTGHNSMAAYGAYFLARYTYHRFDMTYGTCRVNAYEQTKADFVAKDAFATTPGLI